MESNLLCLHLPILHINFVSTKYNWNVLTNPDNWAPIKAHKYQNIVLVSMIKSEAMKFMFQELPAKIAVPRWNIFVCQAGGNVKHDDGTLSMDTASNTDF